MKGSLLAAMAALCVAASAQTCVECLAALHPRSSDLSPCESVCASEFSSNLQHSNVDSFCYNTCMRDIDDGPSCTRMCSGGSVAYLNVSQKTATPAENKEEQIRECLSVCLASPVEHESVPKTLKRCMIRCAPEIGPFLENSPGNGNLRASVRDKLQ